ncbi:hypothetical protein VTK56DRAFT_7883 [Thermocarpiscus australiensis]
MALADPDGTGAGAGNASNEDAADVLLEQSYLTYIIPFATNFNPDEALRQGQGSVESKIASIEQRDQLFFDESVDVYLILRTPCADEQTLRRHLHRFAITLDAQIVNSPAPDRDGPPASETIYSGAVEDVEQAVAVADEPQSGGERYVYAVWKLPVFLGRPRIRLQLPSAVFSGTASLKPPAVDQSAGLGNAYMQSCMPSGMNMLDAFANDPMLGGVKPRLSAQRVSKVAPITKSKTALHRIPGVQNIKLKIYPVLHTRVRFARPNTAPPSAALIALLEIDFTPYFDCEVILDKINLSVTEGTVEDLNIQDGMGLPLSCVAHDHLTFLYKLAPQQLDLVSKTPARDLVITIEVLLLIRPEDEPNPCTPRLIMTWTTNLDFTPPVNPGFGQPKTQPIQRSHRPSQLSIGGNVDAQSLVSPSVSRPDALPSLEAATARTAETTLPDFGITVTFTGPSKPVYVGEEFTWSVFIVNRTRPEVATAPIPVPGPAAAAAAAAATTAAAARKLMLLAVPRRLRRNELRVIRPPSSSTAGGSSSSSKRDPHHHQVADAVLDESVVHAMQRGSVVDCPELVCLSADVRVGPLAPHACAEVELRLLPLRAGVVSLEAVRVVDLGSQEHVDVRDLPLVVAVERGKDGREVT